jgi:large subunit ribosomal protein L2
MGKPLISQRRGKGGVFRAPSHRFKADVRYRDSTTFRRFEIIDLVDDPARTSLLMLIKYEDGYEAFLPAPEGIMVGDILEEGEMAMLNNGNILPLEKIPEGYPVFNLETIVGDGGSLVRASGICAFVISKTGDKVLVKLPSGAFKYLDKRCRATIGCACGGGRVEKPMLKAGVGYYKALARGHLYPIVRGVKMNPYEHPFGGKEHHGAITPKGVGAPPGVHVGLFGAKKTGRRKR